MSLGAFVVNVSAAVYNRLSMDGTRIAELLGPFLGEERISENLIAGILTYVDILLRWNARVNLTAIREPEEIVTRHFGESLFAARHLFPARVGTAAIGCPAERSSAAAAHRASAPDHDDNRERACSAPLQCRDSAKQGPGVSAPVALADVGSGAGFPGIPIKLWAPNITLTLIESNQKKATFLREVCRALILTDINIKNTRAETLPHPVFDVVTLRAVERFASILPSAATLVKPGGRLALLIGAAQLPQAETILPRHNFAPPIPIPLSQSRILAVAACNWYRSSKQVE